MNIIKANIIDLWKNGEIVCVTTNGYIKKNGEAVMGRGNALAMAKTIPLLPKCLAIHIQHNGNVVGPIYKKVIAFPVKPIEGTWKDALSHVQNRFKKSDKIPGFWCKADLSIIEKSFIQLNEIIEKYDKLIKTVYLPLPGINNGQLNFESIEPLLKDVHKKVTLIHL